MIVFKNPIRVICIAKEIRLGSDYLAGEKGPCCRHYHRTLTLCTSLRVEIEHVSSVGMSGSSSSTHRVWKHTWRYATYNLSTSQSYQVVLTFCHEIIIQSHRRLT